MLSYRNLLLGKSFNWTEVSSSEKLHFGPKFLAEQSPIFGLLSCNAHWLASQVLCWKINYSDRSHYLGKVPFWAKVPGWAEGSCWTTRWGEAFCHIEDRSFWLRRSCLLVKAPCWAEAPGQAKISSVAKPHVKQRHLTGWKPLFGQKHPAKRSPMQERNPTLGRSLLLVKAPCREEAFYWSKPLDEQMISPGKAPGLCRSFCLGRSPWLSNTMLGRHL